MYTTIDDELKIAYQRLKSPSLKSPSLRQRGPAPTLADAEVLPLECVGEFLSLDADTQIFAYFRRHGLHLFPALAHIDRHTFVRQSANLWHLKKRLWRRLAEEVTGRRSDWPKK